MPLPTVDCGGGALESTLLPGIDCCFRVAVVLLVEVLATAAAVVVVGVVAVVLLLLAVGVVSPGVMSWSTPWACGGLNSDVAPQRKHLPVPSLQRSKHSSHNMHGFLFGQCIQHRIFLRSVLCSSVSISIAHFRATNIGPGAAAFFAPFASPGLAPSMPSASVSTHRCRPRPCLPSAASL